jgi:general secretion pathway protein E
MSAELRKLIKPDTDIAALREQANREGMKPLRISGALKVASGQTTLDEVLKTSPPAEQN